MSPFLNQSFQKCDSFRAGGAGNRAHAAGSVGLHHVLTMTSINSLPPVLNRGDTALYIGPICPNAYGRWPVRGLCTILSAPHDTDHPAGLQFVIAFKPKASLRARFLAHLSELLPVAA